MRCVTGSSPPVSVAMTTSALTIAPVAGSFCGRVSPYNPRLLEKRTRTDAPSRALAGRRPTLLPTTDAQVVTARSTRSEAPAGAFARSIQTEIEAPGAQRGGDWPRTAISSASTGKGVVAL